MKDYYRILALSSGATEDEIRRAYQRLALQHHPDRNPGDPAAEERFKEISEAYGVLIDPVKRTSYDQWHGANERTTHRGGFGYTQEEIFRDLFNDPRASQVFQELIREFQRAGVRFDRGFLDQLFFGGRGILFGGVFIWGPFGSPRVRIFGPRPREQVQEGQPTQHGEAGFLERLGRKIGGYLLGSSRTLPETVSESSSDRDLHYHLTIPSDEAREGTHVRIAIDRGGGRENLQVRIPPDTRSGTRLRLRGKGLALGRESGDLFLTIEVAPS